MRTTRLIPLTLALLLAGCGTTPPVATSATPTAAVSTPIASVSATPTPTTSTPTPTDTATPSPTDEGASLVLRGDGLGAFDFGAKQAPVSELLSDQLGAPDETSQGILCELNDASPWAETVTYGGLWVQYAAKDTHKSSPRFLNAWGFTLSEPFAAPLQLADGVPLNLGFADLKAKYPKGKLEDLGLGDGTKMFTLPNKMMFIGAKKPRTVQAGELGICE